jgi:hypothetical protein
MSLQTRTSHTRPFITISIKQGEMTSPLNTSNFSPLLHKLIFKSGMVTENARARAGQRFIIMACVLCSIEWVYFDKSITTRSIFGKFMFAVGRGVRESGQALDRLGCRLQGRLVYVEECKKKQCGREAPCVVAQLRTNVAICLLRSFETFRLAVALFLIVHHFSKSPSTISTIVR